MGLAPFYLLEKAIMRLITASYMAGIHNERRDHLMEVLQKHACQTYTMDHNMDAFYT